MIVNRGTLIDGYAEWQLNSTLPGAVIISYVANEFDSGDSESEDIESLRDQIEILHELVDKILLDER